MSAFLGALHGSHRLRSALVVAPATLLSQWTSEFHTWAPYLRVVVLHKSAEAFAFQPASKVSSRSSGEEVLCIWSCDSSVDELWTCDRSVSLSVAVSPMMG